MTTIKTRKDLEQDARESRLNEFREKINSLDSIAADIAQFQESLFEVIPEGSIIDPELIISKLYRVDKPNTNNHSFLDDVDLSEPLNEKSIGEKFGGGWYKIIILFYAKRDDHPEKLIKVSSKNVYFQLDKIWDSRKKEADEINSINHIGRVKQIENKLLGENNANPTGGQNNEMITLMFKMFEAQQNQSNQILIALIQSMGGRNNVSNDLSGIASIMQQMRPAENPMDKILYSLIEKKLLGKESSESKSFMQQLRDFKTVMNELNQPAIEPVKETSGEVIKDFLSDFLPRLPEIADQLLSRKAALFPTRVQKELQPYSQELNLINSNPEVKKQAYETLKTKGYTEQQINTIASRAKIDFDFKNEIEMNQLSEFDSLPEKVTGGAYVF